MPSVCPSSITATEAQNYALDSFLTLPVIRVKPGVELTFEWDGVTADLLGHPMSPTADVDMVELGLWGLTLGEVTTKIHDDELRSQNLKVLLALETERQMTSVSLFSLTSAGAPVPPDLILPYFDAGDFPPDENTYTFVLATGTSFAGGMRLIQAFTLDPATENTTVRVTNSSVLLSWNVDLGRITRPLVAVGTSAITIDWSDMTITGMGGTFVPSDITEVRVGRFHETAAELEASFLDLESLAEHTWRADVSGGSTLSLSTLTDSEGAPFPGIDRVSTWVLALFCGYCANPAPWYLTILESCSR